MTMIQYIRVAQWLAVLCMSSNGLGSKPTPSSCLCSVSLFLPCLDGRRGIFPEGFVELLGPLQVAEDQVFQDDYEIQETSNEEIKSLDSDDDTRIYGIALYQFKAIEEGELDFDVGERICIIKTLEDGWLEGIVNVFPNIKQYSIF
uniref:SH3 domain-containing protein n=1 Tax=Erpetoichthys calabaricus TaxID=27687 RepID=A0A8C4TI63_ERPCA